MEFRHPSNSATALRRRSPSPFSSDEEDARVVGVPGAAPDFGLAVVAVDLGAGADVGQPGSLVLRHRQELILEWQEAKLI